MKYKSLIIFFSIAIPIIVAILFSIRLPNVQPFSFLPPIYTGINATTSIILITALVAIKKKKIKIHQNLMKTAIIFSIIFLLMYVAYHITSDATPYGGTGWLKYFYYFILITHILLSIAIIPLVLITYVRAISKLFPQHKKIAKITFPLWLYITITGVLIYIMIAPYYE